MTPNWRPAHKRLLWHAQRGRCWICSLKMETPGDGDPNGPDAMTIDHLVPKSGGGNGDLKNKALAHEICNSRRGDRRLLAYQWQVVHWIHAEAARLLAGERQQLAFILFDEPPPWEKPR